MLSPEFSRPKPSNKEESKVSQVISILNSTRGSFFVNQDREWETLTSQRFFPIFIEKIPVEVLRFIFPDKKTEREPLVKNAKELEKIISNQASFTNFSLMSLNNDGNSLRYIVERGIVTNSETFIALLNDLKVPINLQFFSPEVMDYLAKNNIFNLSYKEFVQVLNYKNLCNLSLDSVQFFFESGYFKSQEELEVFLGRFAKFKEFGEVNLKMWEFLRENNILTDNLESLEKLMKNEGLIRIFATNRIDALSLLFENGLFKSIEDLSRISKIDHRIIKDTNFEILRTLIESNMIKDVNSLLIALTNKNIISILMRKRANLLGQMILDLNITDIDSLIQQLKKFNLYDNVEDMPGDQDRADNLVEAILQRLKVGYKIFDADVPTKFTQIVDKITKKLFMQFDSDPESSKYHRPMNNSERATNAGRVYDYQLNSLIENGEIELAKTMEEKKSGNQRTLVLYYRGGELWDGIGQMDTQKFKMIAYMLYKYIKEGRSPIYTDIKVVAFRNKICPKEIHELGIPQEVFADVTGQEFEDMGLGGDMMFFTHSQGKEQQRRSGIPVFPFSLTRNPSKFDSDRPYVEMPVFFDINDGAARGDYEKFRARDKGRYLDMMLLNVMRTVINLEQKWLERIRE